MLPRIGDGLADDLLMTQMHAVKETDGQADFAPARSNSLAAWIIFMKNSQGNEVKSIAASLNVKFETGRNV